MTRKHSRAEALFFTVILGALAAVVYHYRHHFYFHTSSLHTTPLVDPAARFRDFLDIHRDVSDRMPYLGSPCNYFPFAYLPAYLLTSWAPETAVSIYLAVAILGTLAFLLWATRELPGGLRARALLALGPLNYGFVFMLDRANYEGLVFLYVAFFFATYRASSQALRNLGLLGLAAGIAAKLHPAVYLALLARDRRFRDLGIVVVLAAALTLGASFFFLEGFPDILFHALFNIRVTQAPYVIGDMGVQNGSSLWGAFKVFFTAIAPVWDRGALPWLLDLYNKASLGYLALVGLAVVFGGLSYGLSVTLLTFALLFVPTVSFDYKLVHLLIPISVLLQDQWDTGTGRRLGARAEIWLSVVLGLLVTPKDWHVVRDDQTVNVFINPLLMAGFSLYLLAQARFRLPGRWTARREVARV